MRDNQQMHKQRMLDERARRQLRLEQFQKNRLKQEREERITLALCLLAMLACIAVAYWWPQLRAFF
jgi:hypothetical protein